MVRITIPVFSHKSDAVLPNVLEHPRHYPDANIRSSADVSCAPIVLEENRHAKHD